MGMTKRCDRVIGIVAVIGLIWFALTANVWGPVVDGVEVQVAQGDDPERSQQ
jgi:hypothetical protein